MESFSVLPYIVNHHTLEKASKQPSFVKNGKVYTNEKNANDWKDHGYAMEDLLSKTCYGEMKSHLMLKKSDCYFLHNQDPFLKLGPFQLEVYSEIPYLVMIHDFITQKEIDHMINISLPHLSRNRALFSSNNAANSHRYKPGEESYFVQKTVQYWLQGNSKMKK